MRSGNTIKVHRKSGYAALSGAASQEIRGVWRAATEGHYFSRSILFQPKSRASRESAPGPTSASATPIAANKIPG
jgi:hypothetical protein